MSTKLLNLPFTKEYFSTKKIFIPFTMRLWKQCNVKYHTIKILFNELINELFLNVTEQCYICTYSMFCKSQNSYLIQFYKNFCFVDKQNFQNKTIFFYTNFYFFKTLQKFAINQKLVIYVQVLAN